MMPELVWIFALIAAPGLLAFALSRRLGARAGWLVVSCAALFNVPTMVGYMFLLDNTSTGGNQFSAYVVSDGMSFSSVGAMASGALAFAVAMVISALVGLFIGLRMAPRSDPQVTP
jgi:hypothetical protein